MRIGVAIPCYKGHIQYLKRCLDSIEAQTVQPDEVVISCSSSTNDDFPELRYSFPFTIIVIPEKRNAGQNRNTAASKLNTDIISFFDADDVMHPQRLEAIRKCFQNDPECGIVLHNFKKADSFDTPCELFQMVEIHQGGLMVNPYSWGVLPRDQRYLGHQGHCTVRKDVLLNIQFSERPEDNIESGVGKEDSLFCRRVLEFDIYKNAFISNILSVYCINTTRVTDKGST
jgi:glycosyltransferase involved in cell wall biosynthesis